MNSEKEHVAFLLKEYEQLWTQARHIDEFQERVPRLFLIVVGAVLAAGGAFARDGLSVDAHRLGGGALVGLALVGLFASLSIPRFRVVRNEYFNAQIAVRGYFVRMFPTLKSALWFPTSGVFDGYAKGFWDDGYRDFRRNDFFPVLDDGSDG